MNKRLTQHSYSIVMIKHKAASAMGSSNKA